MCSRTEWILWKTSTKVFDHGKYMFARHRGKGLLGTWSLYQARIRRAVTSIPSHVLGSKLALRACVPNKRSAMGHWCRHRAARIEKRSARPDGRARSQSRSNTGACRRQAAHEPLDHRLVDRSRQAIASREIAEPADPTDIDLG